MTRQDTLERIKNQLTQANDVMLENILHMLESYQSEEIDDLDKLIEGRELDDWDRQIARDAKSGKLDSLLEDALEAHKTGQTTDLFDGLSSANPLE